MISKKEPTGNNSNNMQVGLVVLVHDTSFYGARQTCKV